MKNEKKVTLSNVKKLTLDDLKVESFVTNLDSDAEKAVMGGHHVSGHETHTAYSDVHAGRPCGC